MRHRGLRLWCMIFYGDYMTTIISYKKLEHTIGVVSWIVYMSSYLGRLNYSAAMADMIAEHVITIDEAGNISVAFFLFYAISQILHGYLAQKIPPRPFLCFGILMVSICNFLMAVTPNSKVLIYIWALNGFSCAIIWNPIL